MHIGTPEEFWRALTIYTTAMVIVIEATIWRKYCEWDRLQVGQTCRYLPSWGGVTRLIISILLIFSIFGLKNTSYLLSSSAAVAPIKYERDSWDVNHNRQILLFMPLMWELNNQRLVTPTQDRYPDDMCYWGNCAISVYMLQHMSGMNISRCLLYSYKYKLMII